MIRLRVIMPLSCHDIYLFCMSTLSSVFLYYHLFVTPGSGFRMATIVVRR
jgi:hypothetical protein